MIDVKDIERRLSGHTLVREIDQTRRGYVRLETAFLYPDGSSVDLFVVEQGGLFPTTRLTDLGQTMAWLLDVQVKPWLSKKRQAFLEDAIRLYRVEQRGGELMKPLESIDELPAGVVALGQACVRVSDLMFTKRSSMTTAFAEQVEEVLADIEYPYVQNAELEGRFGKVVRVDFLVSGPRLASALLGLSSGNASQAHVAATEVFRRWYDLDVPKRTEQRVTVLDDSVDVYRDDDIQRLRDVSDVIAVSDRQALSDLLAA